MNLFSEDVDIVYYFFFKGYWESDICAITSYLITT